MSRNKFNIYSDHVFDITNASFDKLITACVISLSRLAFVGMSSCISQVKSTHVWTLHKEVASINEYVCYFPLIPYM